MADNPLTTFMQQARYAGFTPRPSHSLQGDFVSFFVKDEEAVAQRIDDVLTVYRSLKDDALVGAKLKGVARLLETLGDAGMKGGQGRELPFSALFMVGAYLHAQEPSRELYQHFVSLTKDIPLGDALRSK